MINLQLNNYLL